MSVMGVFEINVVFGLIGLVYVTVDRLWERHRDHVA